MRKSVFLLAMASLAAFADEKQYLWPEGKMPDYQSHQIAAPKNIAEAEGFKADENRFPYLVWHDAPATNPTGACAILISGGSYNSWCDVKLVDSWRERFTALGVRCVSLVYRTPRPKGLPIYMSAWEDGQRAVKIVRSRAGELGYSPENIGAIGMSAGGHLTVMLAGNSLTGAYAPIDAIDRFPCHINWAVANAAAYTTSDGEAGTMATRGGDGADVKVSKVLALDAKTPPMCLTHGGNDPYTPIGSTLIYRELRKRKIPAEVHLYADKGHGAFGLERVVEFLRQIGKIGVLGKEEHVAVYSGAHTARRIKFDLWPEGRMPYPQTNQTARPYVELFLPKIRSTAAVQVVFPGGGYKHCSVVSEGEAVAELFNAKGMAAAVLVYRVPRPLGGLAKHVTAWADAQRAIRIVRSKAGEFALDPDMIGAMGFSAGGHLTLMCATSSRSQAYLPVDKLDKVSVGLKWAFPIYPAYALTDGTERPNTTGGNSDEARLVDDFAFDLSTPPMCFVHGDADVWAAMNSVKAWEKLRRMGIGCDLHTLATRGHCFQFKSSPETGSRTWHERLWEFLEAKKFVK